MLIQETHYSFYVFLALKEWVCMLRTLDQVKSNHIFAKHSF